MQFTDVHYIYNDPRSDVSIERINEVLDAEKPDLVIFTGDVIYGKPAEEGMRTVLNLVSKREIPFAVTFGNHDNEQGLTREELFKIIQSIPHNLTLLPKAFRVLPILFSLEIRRTGSKDAEILYVFDSTFLFTDKGDRRI